MVVRELGELVDADASACPPVPAGPPRSAPARGTPSRARAWSGSARDRSASRAARDAPRPARRPSRRDAAASTPRASRSPPAPRPAAPSTPRTARAPAARAAPAAVPPAPGGRPRGRHVLQFSPESRQPCTLDTEVIACEAKTPHTRRGRRRSRCRRTLRRPCRRRRRRIGARPRQGLAPQLEQLRGSGRRGRMPSGRGDDPALHAADTLAAGRGLCRPSAVRLLTEEAPARIAELRRLGVRFDDGLGREGGHSRARVVHAGGADTGRHIANVLTARARGASPDPARRGRADHDARRVSRLGRRARHRRVRGALGADDEPARRSGRRSPARAGGRRRARRPRVRPVPPDRAPRRERPRRLPALRGAPRRRRDAARRRRRALRRRARSARRRRACGRRSRRSAPRPAARSSATGTRP